MRVPALVFVVSFLLFSGCLKPPLVLTRTADGIDVSVSTLGEYPTSISRLQLRDMNSGEIVWELTAKDGASQIWGFLLRPGDNPTLPEGQPTGRYDVVVPTSGRSFVLQKGKAYEISVWNKAGTRRKSADFTL